MRSRVVVLSCFVHVLCLSGSSLTKIMYTSEAECRRGLRPEKQHQLKYFMDSLHVC